jgi:hypothetical protein
VAIAGSLASCGALSEITFDLKGSTDQEVNDGLPVRVEVFQLRGTTAITSRAWVDVAEHPMEDLGADGALGAEFIRNPDGNENMTAWKRVGKDSSHTIYLKLSSDAKYIGLLGRFKSGEGTPMVAYPVEELNGATVQVQGYSFIKEDDK